MGSEDGDSTLLAIERETMELLEWPRLAADLAGFASTTAGRALCGQLPLAATREESVRLLGETTELLGLDGLTEGGLSFLGVVDLSDTLRHCGKGVWPPVSPCWRWPPPSRPPGGCGARSMIPTCVRSSPPWWPIFAA